MARRPASAPVQVLRLLVAAACAAGLGAWPASAWAGEVGRHAMLLGVGMALLGALVGLVPLLVGAARGATGASMALLALVAMGLRMFCTLAGALVVLLADLAPAGPFGLGLVLGYLALLAVEVFVTVKEFGQNPSPHGTEDAHAEVLPAAAGAPRDAAMRDREGGTQAR
jgi:hypothetical protein